MDDDGETTSETPMFLYCYLKIHLYLCLLVKETKNPQQLACGRSIPATHGDKTNRFYPPFVAGIDLAHQGVMDCYSLS